MRRHLPNLLTLLRFPLTGLFLYGSFQESMPWHLIATVTFLLCMLTDLLDGLIARRMGTVSNIGSFLDPLADKVLVLSGFFVLWKRPDLIWGGWLPWVVGSVLIIALGIIASAVLAAISATDYFRKSSAPPSHVAHREN